jgi:hypothetical protein
MIDPDALIHITDENDTEVLVSGQVVPVDDMIAVNSCREVDEKCYGGYDDRGNQVVIRQSIVAEIEHRE